MILGSGLNKNTFEMESVILRFRLYILSATMLIGLTKYNDINIGVRTEHTNRRF